MDRNVTVRFYEIEAEGDGRSVEDALRRAITRSRTNREIAVGDGIVLRLEHLEEDDGLLLGDFTRIQSDNLPSHPTAAATDPLPINRLGHHTAFCFDPLTQIVALQFDMKMAASRLCAYIGRWGNGASFGHLPVLREDALERFEDETPTRLTVKVARVSRFAAAAPRATDFERAFETMGALFDAPTVEVTVSARGSDGGIDKETALATVRRLLGMKERFDGIRSISGATNESPDAFNFLSQLLKSTATLDLPNNEPTVGRAARMAFARRCFDEQRNYLRATYTRERGA